MKAGKSISFPFYGKVQKNGYINLKNAHYILKIQVLH